ncbi:MAG: hypothetical protein JWM77_644 [Rhodospirillales bacterium]|jgi:hypothetical protein|nr:hypothetical protein [Rhodospirillales bacterium]
MKSVLALAALVAFAAAPAVAKDCGARPAAPSVPSGKTATETDMKTAGGKVQAYTKAMNDYMKCLVDEANSARNEGTKVSKDYEVAVNEYNKTPAKQ